MPVPMMSGSDRMCEGPRDFRQPDRRAAVLSFRASIRIWHVLVIRTAEHRRATSRAA